MRQLKEALIGKSNVKNSSSRKRDLNSFKDLEYGDIVSMTSSLGIDDTIKGKDGYCYYIYFPASIVKEIVRSVGGDDDLLESYVDSFVTTDIGLLWPAGDFKPKFPRHVMYDVNLISIEGHVNNLKSISNEDDVVNILSKYIKKK